MLAERCLLHFVPTFPLLQYNGGGQADQSYDDFVFKFIVASSKTENLNAIQNIVGLFGQISADASWTAISSGLGSPLFQNLQKTAQTFQGALQAAGALQNQLSVSFDLKANGGPNDGRVAITIPALFGDNGGNGYMAIYIRRYGSIALANDNPTISLSDVFDSQALPNRQCNQSSIAAGTCNANTDSMRSSLLKLLKGIDKAFDVPTVNELIIDANTPARQGNIFETCKGLRTIARLNMHLSTLDELIVRWAATKEGHLQEALQDDTKSKALAQANKVSVTDLKDMCWNEGDVKVLNGVAAFLKKKVEQ